MKTGLEMCNFNRILTAKNAERKCKIISNGRISLFGQVTLILSSVRSEIIVDQPYPMENQLRRSGIFRVAQSRCRLYEALISEETMIFKDVTPMALLKTEMRPFPIRNQDSMRSFSSLWSIHFLVAMPPLCTAIHLNYSLSGRN